MGIGAALGAANKHTFRRTHHEASGRPKQRRPAQSFQLLPKLISTLHQGHVGWMLEIGFADDAGLPMRGSSLVRRRETIEAKHAAPVAGEMERRGAAHSAKANENHVVVRRHATRVARTSERRNELMNRWKP